MICREKTDKEKLVRIVRTLSGMIKIDSSAKMAGRGAYLCRRQQCWHKIMSAKRLDYIFRSKVSDDVMANIAAFASGLDTN